jgi:hypothetical protein
MSTEKINRGILLTVVALGTIAYIALYDRASTNFRLYVPLCVAALLALVVADVVSTHRPRRH